MNDFTKKELMALENAFYTLLLKEAPEKIDDSKLLKKLEWMIDNYCEHETDQGGCGGDLLYTCKKCGHKYYFGDFINGNQ